jgi:hypothetical protein
MKHDSIITFCPLNDIQVTKVQKYDDGTGTTQKCILGTKERTRYLVDFPGFTPRDILRYTEEQVLSYAVPWFHHSCIFVHMKFEMNEIDDAVRTMEKNRSIEPFSLTKASYHNHGQANEVRYGIAEKLRGLMRLVWSLYKEKLPILETKYMVGILNEDDKIWLLYLLGQRNTEKLMLEWEDKRRHIFINEKAIEIEDGRLVLAKKSHIRIKEMEFKAKVDELLKSYLPVLREYGLPESFVRTILF